MKKKRTLLGKKKLGIGSEKQMNRIIWQRATLNRNKKWFEFWKPTWVAKKYYLKVKNNYLVLGEEVKNERLGERI